MELCASCNQMSEPAATYYELHYCQDCVSMMPIPSEVYGLAFLLASIPFHVGDKVECRTAGELYDGIGTVKEIDTDFKMGGTPVFPAFRVLLEEKAESHLPDELWYTENGLKKVG